MKKIVVIDDDLTVCEIIKDCLDQEGYGTFIATDAAYGLELSQKHQPDLILLDIVMPRMGGLECLIKLQQLCPRSIVVVITGVTDETMVRPFIERGAFDYFHKPFNYFQFKELILDRIFS